MAPTGLLLEYVDDEHDVPWRHDLLTDPPQWENGFMRLPTKPGLGFEIDESALQEQVEYREELGGEYYYETDGSVADW